MANLLLVGSCIDIVERMVSIGRSSSLCIVFSLGYPGSLSNVAVLACRNCGGVGCKDCERAQISTANRSSLVSFSTFEFISEGISSKCLYRTILRAFLQLFVCVPDFNLDTQEMSYDTDKKFGRATPLVWRQHM